MKTRTAFGISFLILFTFLSVFSISVMAQTAEDTSSVYKFVEAYQQTISTHDPAALTEFFTEDADLLMEVL